jgi:PBP1b-binding outer membrane lipoprotein LpoB
MKKIILILFIIFFLTSCCINNCNEKQETNVNNYNNNTKKDKQENYRVVLKTLFDINKINRNTNILIIDEMFWKDNYKKIMNKLLKYNFKKGPLLVNVI